MGTAAAPGFRPYYTTALKSSLKHGALLSVTLLALIYTGSSLKAAEPAPDPAGFDILGMKLGMTAGEIEAAIKAYNPSLDIITTSVPITEITSGDQRQRLGGGKILQIVRAQRVPPGAFPEFTVAFTVSQPGRAFSISRRTDFSPDQQPLIDKTVLQLREKYGPESFKSNAFDWVFDKAGKRLVPNVPGKPFQFNFCSHLSNNLHGGVSYANNQASEFYSPECGTDLRVELTPSAGSNLISVLFEHLVGDPIAVDDIQKLMAKAKAEQERLRQQQEQKASGVRAPL
jgi:hypothetical protein